MSANVKDPQMELLQKVLDEYVYNCLVAALIVVLALTHQTFSPFFPNQRRQSITGPTPRTPRNDSQSR